jgi:hypothetical protein
MSNHAPFRYLIFDVVNVVFETLFDVYATLFFTVEEYFNHES